MYLFSLPLIVAFTLSDDKVLSNALMRVQSDGVFTIPRKAAKGLANKWEKKYKQWNIWAQVIGLVVGIAVAIANYWVYVLKHPGYWIVEDEKLLPVGWIYLYCIFVFYAIIPFYIIRCIASIRFLRDLVRNARIWMLPAHPDKCGGLRPVGQLGLRNQYVLTILGINIVILVIITLVYLKDLTLVYGLIGAATITYVVVGPMVFLGPLLPFRAGMLQTKADLMGGVAQRLRIELRRVRKLLAKGTITKADEELIDRLRKIGSVVDELPVWPFDTGTLRRFLTAFVIPIFGAASYKVLEILLG
jgi:hypothetical protein